MGFSLDISNHKDGISIEGLKNEGLVHLYVKATEGMGYVDPCFRKFCSEANRLGIPLGAYHFATANPNIEGQAQDFYNCVKDVPMQLRYCLDMERSMPSGVSHSDFARRFITKFEQLMGKTGICCIYASQSYARDNFDADIKSRIPLWVAHYGVSHYGETGFSTICGWQYSESEVHLGYECDANIFYDSVVIGSTTGNGGGSTTVEVTGKVAEYQRLANSLFGCGLVVDNIYGSKTEASFVNYIGIIDNKYPDLVKWLQRRLFQDSKEWDGIIGNGTRSAVRQFQSAHGLTADGIVGVNTFRVLCTC